MFQLQIVSSLEKVFLDSKIQEFPKLEKLSALRGDRVSFQIAYAGRYPTPQEFNKQAVIGLSGSLAPYVRLRRVENVPVELPIFPWLIDDNYLRTAPGLYPDVLSPMTYAEDDAPCGKIRVMDGLSRALWVDFTVPADMKGKQTLTVTLTGGDDTASATLTLNVIPAELPKQTVRYTEWFHCDGLSAYYNVPVWSDEHFRIVKNFAKTARENGINLLLVPTFTPPLDTAVGGERLTTQLVKVEKKGDSYVFGFDLLDRYLDVISSVGIEYYEIAHFYTQWGAYHAPKVVAVEDGVEKRIFGWETDSLSVEYRSFLRQFLTAFLAHMKERGEDEKCFFHISDEPNVDHLDRYRAAKEQIADLLEGYTIMDALSHFEFFEQGVTDTPIPSNNHIQPFLDHNVPNLWTYYCCGQCVGVSNRLIAMPSWRNRYIGMQMFKYDIVGFLQWGYNFYNNRQSSDSLIPFLDVSGEEWVPAGDTCSVYPGRGGEALESLRLVVFNEGLEDMRAMQLAADLCGKEKVVSAMEKTLGKKVVFSECAHSASEVLRVREAVNAMIRRAVAKK